MSQKKRIVLDDELGSLVFPPGDRVISSYIEEHGHWEKEEIFWLRTHVRPGMKCLNVGANVGYFTTWMSKLAGRRGFVWSVEANPNLIWYLALNLFQIADLNTVIVPKAAGSSTGEIELFINEPNCGDNRVFDPRATNGGGDYMFHGFDEEPKSVTVPIDTIDNIVQTSRIDVALIDTQGWDHEVIRGMSNVLRKWKPKVLTEFTPKWISDLGEEPEDVLKEYEDFGYLIKVNVDGFAGTISPKHVLDLVNSRDLLYVNLSLEPQPERKFFIF